MIKTFEQFVSEVYGNPINESFQSSKLRDIINQHGKPKYSFDNKMLYDLKDNEIIDVVSNRDEYWEKYGRKRDDKKNGEQETFMIELKDGSCIVISNLNIFKRFDDMFGDKAKKEMRELFKKKHSDRHVGNLGKDGGDEIHKQHLIRKYSIKLKPYIQEIVDTVKSTLNDIDISECEIGINEIEDIELNLNGEECLMNVYYKFDHSDSYNSHGASFCDFTISFEKFELFLFIDNGEDYVRVTNKDLGITYETFKDLYEDIVYEDEECGVYDFYEYYGVDPSDFV